MAVVVTAAFWSPLFVSTSAHATAEPLGVSRPRLTAAPMGGLSVVLATLSNKSNFPVILYRVTSSIAPAAMLHYDVNMCQKGNQMNLLPMVVLPAHRSLTLSTQGVGAMLTKLRRPLRVGETLTVSVTYAINLRRATLSVPLTVVPAPKGLVTKPPKNAVG